MIDPPTFTDNAIMAVRSFFVFDLRKMIGDS